MHSGVYIYWFVFFYKYQGAKEEKKTAKEEQWLKQIEQQAMKDYRNKDLQVGYYCVTWELTFLTNCPSFNLELIDYLQDNSDLTAKIFNEKREEREISWDKESSKVKLIWVYTNSK